MKIIEQKKTIVEVGSREIVINAEPYHVKSTCRLLQQFGSSQKMLALKTLRHIYSIGLIDAKEIVDAIWNGELI